MKKLLLNTVFLLLAVWACAQQTVTVSGLMTRIADGSPVAGQFVFAVVDPTDSLSGFGYDITDSDGTYSFELIDVPAGISELQVRTYDICDSAALDLVQAAPIVNNAAVANFQLCAELPPVEDCSVWATYNNQGTLTPMFYADFYTLDGAGAASYLWDFGDGATSTEASPTHTYAVEGEYLASVTITSETGCTATQTFWVWVYDDPSWGNCYGWAQLSAIDSLTSQFFPY